MRTCWRRCWFCFKRRMRMLLLLLLLWGDVCVFCLFLILDCSWGSVAIGCGDEDIQVGWLSCVLLHSCCFEVVVVGCDTVAERVRELEVGGGELTMHCMKKLLWNDFCCCTLLYYSTDNGWIVDCHIVSSFCIRRFDFRPFDHSIFIVATLAVECITATACCCCLYSNLLIAVAVGSSSEQVVVAYILWSGACLVWTLSFAVGIGHDCCFMFWGRCDGRMMPMKDDEWCDNAHHMMASNRRQPRA